MSKKMEKDLNIHTKYGNDESIFIVKRSAFLSVVAKKYNLKEEEIEIYEIGKTFKRKITVETLQDIMRVEIRKQAISKPKPNETNDFGPTKNAASVEEMCLKLEEKRPMTDQERKHLLVHLRALPPNLKRRLETGDPQPPKMRNRKIQACPKDFVTVGSQADIDLNPLMIVEAQRTEWPQEIKKYAKNEKKDPEKVKDLLANSFNSRRNSILKDSLTVAFLKEQYPILFTLSEIRNELDRILSDGTAEKFLSNIEKYCKPIMSMAMHDDPILTATAQKKAETDSPLSMKYAVEVGSILMLSSIIKERRSFLKLEDSPIPDFNEPFIEAETNLHGLFDNRHVFKVYAEHILVCEATDFKEAILCLMACYFIFNIRYPADCFNTLAVMEKIYLEGIDTEIADIDNFSQQLIKCLHLKAAIIEKQKQSA